MRTRALWPFVLNRGAPLAKGLVGYWPLAAGRGNLAVDLARTNHGTLTNFGSIPTSGWATETIGTRVLSFDGSNDYVTLGNVLNFERTDPFSLSIWCRLRGALVDGAAMCGNFGTGSKGYGLLIINSNPSQFALVVASNAGGGANSLIVRSNTAVVSGNLYHFSVTYDGSSTPGGIKTYLNGVATATTTAVNSLSSSIASTNNYIIGARSTLTSNINANLFEHCVHNRVLSAAEVYSLWHPSTRWQLRYQPGAKVWSIPAGGGGGGGFKAAWAVNSNSIIGSRI